MSDMADFKWEMEIARKRDGWAHTITIVANKVSHILAFHADDENTYRLMVAEISLLFGKFEAIKHIRRVFAALQCQITFFNYPQTWDLIFNLSAAPEPEVE